MESDASIWGFDFHRDDIAFSYNGHVAGTPNFGSVVYAREALDDGGGEAGKTSILQGSMNGQISSESCNFFPGEMMSSCCFAGIYRLIMMTFQSNRSPPFPNHHL
jgi:hypothetical protein